MQAVEFAFLFIHAATVFSSTPSVGLGSSRNYRPLQGLCTSQEQGEEVDRVPVLYFGNQFPILYECLIFKNYQGL